MTQLTSVPTNILTGFLGAGKTSAIAHLLTLKPASERWAILVNEFGEIGIDGALLKTVSGDESGVFIREVPGGCMCCAVGVPMQVALNELLRQSRPDRLLIEPTGLGHPQEVLKVLSGTYYQSVLNVEHTLTLVDARKLSDERYTRHETFNQQIAIADVVVGNKADKYQSGDPQRLIEYVAQHASPDTTIVFAEHGRIDLALLQGATLGTVMTEHEHPHSHPASAQEVGFQRFPASGVIKAVNQGEGYVSVGWRLAPTLVFDCDQLQRFVEQADVERFKAVFITSTGVVSFNKTPDSMQQLILDSDVEESRVEIIAETLDPALETNLFACLYQSLGKRS